MINALNVAGSIFALVAFLHLLRLFYKTKITIAKKTIPMNVSVIGFIITAALAFWMFKVSGVL